MPAPDRSRGRTAIRPACRRCDDSRLRTIRSRRARVTVGMMRLRVILAVAALLALVPATSATAATSKVKRCTPKGAKTIHKTSEARVYTLKGPGPQSENEDVQ